MAMSCSAAVCRSAPVEMPCARVLFTVESVPTMLARLPQGGRATILWVIDWLMELPPLQEDFERELDEYEEGQTMPFVTSIEREAMFEMIEDALRAKFGDEATELLTAIHELNDAEK
jgi:hypothetical protein